MNQQFKLGVDLEAITAAEKELGVLFPDTLKAIWQVSNGIELPGGWIVYPIFDPSNPRKTCNSVVYENTPDKGRWPYMADELIAIASNDCGNQLVLRAEAGQLLPDIFVWNHERNSIKRCSKTLDYILAKAEARVAAIEEARVRSRRLR